MIINTIKLVGAFAKSHKILTAAVAATAGTSICVGYKAKKADLKMHEYVQLHALGLKEGTTDMIDLTKKTIKGMSDPNIKTRNERIDAAVDDTPSKGIVKRQQALYLNATKMLQAVISGVASNKATKLVFKLAEKFFGFKQPKGALGIAVNIVVSQLVSPVVSGLIAKPINKFTEQMAYETVYATIVEQHGADHEVVKMLTDYDLVVE